MSHNTAEAESSKNPAERWVLRALCLIVLVYLTLTYGTDWSDLIWRRDPFLCLFIWAMMLGLILEVLGVKFPKLGGSR